MFIFRQKKLCLSAPSRGLFYVSVPYHPPTAKAYPSSASFAGMAAAPQGLFLYDKFGKDECSCAFAKPNARLRDCALYGVQRFFDRVRQPVPAVLACGKDLLQIGYGAGFFKAVKKEKHRAVSPDVFLRQIQKSTRARAYKKSPRPFAFSADKPAPWP